jgi:hypothetical protein
MNLEAKMSKMHHLNNNLHNNLLSEALEYKDLEGIVKPSIHIDEFSSKMGDDDDIIVVSFYVRNQLASKDLVSWFEKGYDFVLDADKSPGELKPGRFLVYVEMRRRSSAGKHLQQLLDDLGTLTEFKPEEWTMQYEGEDYPWSQEEFERLVPLSPKEYRETHEGELNEMRVAAGLETKRIYDQQDKALQKIQSAAGII